MSGKKGARQKNSGILDTWVERYLAGETQASIAVSAGVTRSAVGAALRRRGVAPAHGTDRHYRAYTCNHAFFDVIDTEPKAYWLGFTAADGGIYKATVGFGLAIVDVEHLRRLVTAIEGTQPVTTSLKVDGLYRASLQINSVRMVRALAEHGVTVRKSLTYGWPSTVPDALVRHFLRGYVDGDGSWHQHPSRTDRATWVWSVLGTPEFLVGARSFLAQGAGLRPIALRDTKTPGLKKLVYGGNQQVARIAHWLYAGASIWLPRKRERAEAAIAEASRTVHGWDAHPEGCVRCGRTTVPYAAHGMCRYCTNTVWKHRGGPEPVQRTKRRA